MDKELQRKIKIGPFIPENSDGCTVLSWVYQKLTGKKLPFRACCVAHDEDYWYGGTRRQRRESDKRLRKCVYSYNNGTVLGKLFYAVLSWSMWAAVRLGGSPALPTGWRWQFSNPYTTRAILHGYVPEED